MRDRDRGKVSTNLTDALHETFQKWAANDGLTTAEALRQAVVRLLQEQKSVAVAQTPASAAEATKTDQPRVRVVPEPVNDCDRARSLSANVSAIAPQVAVQEPSYARARPEEEAAMQEYLQSPVTHALLSRWRCSRCGTPVDQKWTHCPVCGCEEMKSRDMGTYPGFDEVMDHWHNTRVFTEP